MALDQLLADLEELVNAATAAFQASSDAESLEQVRVEFLGAKNGRLKRAQKGMGQIDKADRPEQEADHYQ
jgi:phenylalanyl-tRNA synthetase alpha chain